MLAPLCSLVLAALLVNAAPIAAASSAPTAPGTPAVDKPHLAPLHPVTETLWGTRVVDRYRYLEDQNNTESQAFFKDQAAATQKYLEQLGPAREILGRRIRALDRSSVSVSSVSRVGDHYFYQRQNPQDESPSLYIRDANASVGRLLIDPSAIGSGHSHHTIDWMVPSLDAHFVAYGLSAGGSEDSVLHIVDAITGRRLPEAIDRTRFGATGWLPDGKSLFYIRLPRTTAATPVVDRERYFRAYLHRVGQAASGDRAVFGWNLDPQIHLAPDDVPNLSVAPNSPYVIAAVQHGVRNELTIYTAPLRALGQAHPHWRKVADVADAVTGFDVRGSTIYLLSHRDASNFRVYSTALETRHSLRELVRPGRAVIEQIGVAADALYVRLLDGGIGRVARVAFSGRGSDPLVSTIGVPYDGTITTLATDPRVHGVTFGLTGWTHSLLWYRSDTKGRISDTNLKPLSPVDASFYTSREVLVQSHDGTLVPLSIVLKKGSALDGTHPTYLEGYGAYGVTISPYFSPTRNVWLERGGIYAVAHVRGGGEYGENWHQAAMRTTKLRSVEDYLACAHYLIDQKYTSPKYLAGEGTSAGGIVIGGAITQAPQLFAAALDVVGVSDALRSEFSANGPGNIPEFGSVTHRAEFSTLLAIDAYQHVVDGTHYPAVLLVTGLNDPRVPPWQLGKFAARLQAANGGPAPIYLRVTADAGHGFLAASRTQSEEQLTDEYAFLLHAMGKL